MDIKGKFYIPCVIILIITIGCSSSQLAQKYIDKEHIFSSYKLSNNPDEIAFHFEIKVLEEDSTPSKRRVRLMTASKPVFRSEFKGEYTTILLTYTGSYPQTRPNKNGVVDVDYMTEDTLKLSIWKSKVKIPPIPIKIGKRLKVTLYLKDEDNIIY